MRDRLHHPLLDASIRAAGLAGIGLSWLCGHELWRMGVAIISAVTFLLALVTFLAASAGSAALALGTHLFDEVEVSRRWARKPLAHDRPADPTSAVEP